MEPYTTTPRTKSPSSPKITATAYFSWPAVSAILSVRKYTEKNPARRVTIQTRLIPIKPGIFILSRPGIAFTEVKCEISVK